MKRNDYILALASGFLTVDENKLENLFSRFSQRFELEELAKANTVSLGGRAKDHSPIHFIDWITSLRKEGIRNVQFVYQSLGTEDLPSHILGAFAGVEELLMQVSGNIRSATYTLRTYYSSQYEISANDFISFVDAQPVRDRLWERVEYHLNESNRLNNRPEFEKEKVKEYIAGESGKETFEFMLGQLITEIQVEAEVMKAPITIPPTLQKYFYKSDYFSGMDSNMEVVYFYPVKEVSGKELVELASAQSFHWELWSRCEKELKDFPDPELPALAAKDLQEYIGSLPMDKSQSASHLVSRVLRDLCQEKNLKPLVPEGMKDKFGPDEMEEKRANVRSKVSSQGWFLAPNQNPWEMYLFEEIHNPFATKAPRELAEIQTEYQELLQQATVFAKKIHSGFSEAFSLGAFLLQPKLPAGDFGDQHFAELENLLQQNGYSDYAKENLRSAFYMANDFKGFGWPMSKLYGLCALSITDVFGGMGSWNDQYAGEDQGDYEKISSALFLKMKDFYVALLSN